MGVDQFFRVGGTLGADVPSYVTRAADEALLHAVLEAHYCNVLTARQMGKSSLMVRTVARLKDAGIRSVVIDLTSIGTQVTPSEWYIGLLNHFTRDLSLGINDIAWWDARKQLGPVQRFANFLRQVVLTEVHGPIVVFVDEIDSTLALPFSDDFFAAIRAAYNARASDPTYQRLTFVLLGVARPSDLIKDHNRTPYNIGTSIPLTDFTASEAKVLLQGLAPIYKDSASDILTRVLYWTDGHPYLTQKVCAEIVGAGGQWPASRIDALVTRLFIAQDARRESNLQFIRDWLVENRKREAMLALYQQVWEKQKVMDEERSPIKSQLKLGGLVKARPDGTLIVRNRIYARVFDDDWIKAHRARAAGGENPATTPPPWITLAIVALVILFLVVTLLLIGDVF